MGVTNLTRWPWTIDAADYGGAITNPPVTILAPINNGPFGQQTQQNVAFGTFNWTAHDAAEGDQVILTDTNGKEVWRSAPATGADFADQFRPPDTVYVLGLILKQMQHGVLEIHYR